MAQPPIKHGVRYATKGSMAARWRDLVVSFVCLTILFPALFPAAGYGAITGNRWEMREAALAAQYTALLQNNPDDAAVHYIWGKRLEELAGEAARSKTTSMAVWDDLQKKAREQYARSAMLKPREARYAFALADGKVRYFSLLRRWKSSGEAATQPSEVPASNKSRWESLDGAAYTAAKAAVAKTHGTGTKESYDLLHSWGGNLAHQVRMAEPSLPDDVAVALLTEADRAYGILVKRSPEEEALGRSNAYYYDQRGEIAVFSANLEPDASGRQRLLLQSREYFGKAVALNKKEVTYWAWSAALSEEHWQFKRPGLRFPAFTEELLRERITVMRAMPGGAYSTREKELCLALNRLALSGDEKEALELLREALPLCQTAADSLKKTAETMRGYSKEVIQATAKEHGLSEKEIKSFLQKSVRKAEAESKELEHVLQTIHKKMHPQ